MTPKHAYTVRYHKTLDICNCYTCFSATAYKLHVFVNSYIVTIHISIYHHVRQLVSKLVYTVKHTKRLSLGIFFIMGQLCPVNISSTTILCLLEA